MYLQYPGIKEDLKIKVGDFVSFEGHKFIVNKLGLKFAEVESVETGLSGLVKVTQILKWVDPELQDEGIQFISLDEEFNAD